MLYLLSCCGSNLVEMTLRSKIAFSILHWILELCPNVQHLRLCSMQLDRGTVDGIKNALGGKPHSPCFENCFKVR